MEAKSDIVVKVFHLLSWLRTFIYLLCLCYVKAMS